MAATIQEPRDEPQRRSRAARGWTSGLTPLRDGDTGIAMRKTTTPDPRRKRTPRSSRVDTVQLVLPGLTNVHGTIFGGMLMQWIDIAAGISAARHCGGPVVTASMDRLHFLHPVRLGEVVTVQAQVNFAGHTSMEIGVRVLAEDRNMQNRRQTTRAYLTFVAVDDDGRPRAVPPLSLETSVDRRRFAAARARRAVRLRERRAMEKK
jgi:acyl-CoA hydrolase